MLDSGCGTVRSFADLVALGVCQAAGCAAASPPTSVLQIASDVDPRAKEQTTDAPRQVQRVSDEQAVLATESIRASFRG